MRVPAQNVLAPVKKIVSVFAAMLISVVASLPTAQADLYLDFGISNTGIASSYGAATVPGTWNAITALGTSSSLLEAKSGNASSLAVTLSADSIFGFSGPASNDTERLLKDHFFSNDGSPWSVTITGLANNKHRVFYYAAAAAGAPTGPFTINGNVASPIPGGITSLVQGTSWELFEPVDVTTNSITITSTSNSGIRGLAGLQLVSIPEPTSLILFAIGGFASVRFRRRR